MMGNIERVFISLMVNLPNWSETWFDQTVTNPTDLMLKICFFEGPPTLLKVRVGFKPCNTYFSSFYIQTNFFLSVFISFCSTFPLKTFFLPFILTILFFLNWSCLSYVFSFFYKLFHYLQFLVFFVCLSCSHVLLKSVHRFLKPWLSPPSLNTF